MMKASRHKTLGAWLAAGCAAVAVAGCESVECPLNNTVYTTYGFYVMENGKPVPVRLVDTLTVTAAGTDSVLINRIYNVSQVELPMSYFADTDTLALTFTDQEGYKTHDTVWVNKYNHEHYESPSCPTAMFHTVNGVRSTHRFIDTVTIVNPNVNYYASENFKIIFYSGN